MRQAVQTHYDPGPDVIAATLAYDYPAGWTVPAHAHGAAQLIYATHGIMQIRVGTALWIIPPQFAVWIPGRVVHGIHMAHPVSMRTLYLRDRFMNGMAAQCAVLHVTPFLRALILEAVRLGTLRRDRAVERALAEVLRDAVQAATPIPAAITVPTDKRAASVAEALLADLARRPTLATVCRKVGVSVRTVERCFRREVGTDVAAWARQARLMRAVELLLSGRSVSETAYAVGYQQPSAFIAAFRKLFGATPKAWAASLAAKA